MNARHRRTLPTLLVAAGLLMTACASKTARPVTPVPPATASGPTTTSLESAVVATALLLRGTPYKAAGSGPLGFDCSGFVQFVFAQHGLVLPREVIEQYRKGRAISRDRLRAGDLVFFQTEGTRVSHVGIVIDDRQFVHAPSTNGVVRIERYDNSYWGPRYVGARRIS